MSVIICPEELCTGCAACHNICPTESIRMVADKEGFSRPEINTDLCNDCGACKHVCPVLHQQEPNDSSNLQVYACWNKDEKIRFQSASGGAFSAFATNILNMNGIVFGVAFNEKMRALHMSVKQKEKLFKLRSSKYVQSEIGRTYLEVREHLRQNRKVLFSGTPCQIAALYSLLGKDNKYLFTCDMLCHGVPSPGLFAKYIDSLERYYNSEVTNINMRHKRKGWHLSSTVGYFSDGKERVLTGHHNSFMFGFSNCLTLRPACYRCPYTRVARQGDITLADFWGIGEFAEFKHNTQNGVSLILVNSDKGRQLFGKSANLFHSEARTQSEAIYNRTKLSHPLPEPRNRQPFFVDYQKLEYDELVKLHLVDKGVKAVIKRLVPRALFFYSRKYFNIISNSSQRTKPETPLQR